MEIWVDPSGYGLSGGLRILETVKLKNAGDVSK